MEASQVGDMAAERIASLNGKLDGIASSIDALDTQDRGRKGRPAQARLVHQGCPEGVKRLLLLSLPLPRLAVVQQHGEGCGNPRVALDIGPIEASQAQEDPYQGNSSGRLHVENKPKPCQGQAVRPRG